MFPHGTARILCRRGDWWMHEHYQAIQEGAQEFAVWWQGMAARNEHAPMSYLWLQDQIAANHPLDIVRNVTMTTRHGKAVHLQDCLFRGYSEARRMAFFEFSVIPAQQQAMLPRLVELPEDARALTAQFRDRPYLALVVPMTEALESIARVILPLRQIVEPGVELWPVEAQTTLLEAVKL